MAKKFYEFEVNSNKIVSSSKSKTGAVAKSVAEKEVEAFGVSNINNASATKKVSKRADAGYEKNITAAKKRTIKSKISEVEDYTDFCFRKTAKPVKQVEAAEEFDLIDFIKEVLAVNVVENDDVKNKIAEPSKDGDNDGLVEYFSMVATNPLYELKCDRNEMLDYIKDVLNITLESDDEVEAKIMSPSKDSDNDGIAEYFANRVLGIENTYQDFPDVVEYIKEVLDIKTIDEDENVIAAKAEVVAEKKPCKVTKTSTVKTRTVKTRTAKNSTSKAETKKAKTTKVSATKVVTTKTATKPKKVTEKAAEDRIDVIKQACENALNLEVEGIMSVARTCALFDLEKTMLN